MAKEEKFEMIGKVRSSMPNAMFKVELENGITIVAHISGRIRQNSIRVVPGDRVVVEMSTYDLTKGRIVWRSKK